MGPLPPAALASSPRLACPALSQLAVPWVQTMALGDRAQILPSALGDQEQGLLEQMHL